MAREWDELARINAAYSIVSTAEFEKSDAVSLEAFMASGREQAERILAGLALGETRPLTMVEIGCGIGRMTHTFAARFAKVIALDVSPEMIARARELGSGLANVEFRVGSGRDLGGIPDGSVDFVFSWFVLQHVPDARDVLGYVRETGRVLKPGGRAFLHMKTSRGTMDHLRRALERRLYFLLPLALRRALAAGKRARLEQEFAVRFRVWRGGVVRGRDVERAAVGPACG